MNKLEVITPILIMTEKELIKLLDLLNKFNKWKFNNRNTCIQNTSDSVQDTITNLE